MPLVTGGHPGVSVHAGAREPDLPIGGVGAEEEDRLPGVAGRVHRIALLSRPVLVVADGQEGAAAQQRRGTLVGDVEVGGVRDVVAVSLEKARHQRLVPQHLPAAGVARVRPVEAHLDGECTWRIVQAGAAPVVVRLRGQNRRLHQEIRGPLVLHHQGNQRPERVIADDSDDVQPAHCVRRHAHGERRRPGTANQAGCGVGRARRLVPEGQRLRRAEDSPSTRSAVPTQPEQSPARFHADAVRSRHELDCIARAGAHPVSVGVDLPAVRAVEAAVPGRVSGQLILCWNRVHVAGAIWRPLTGMSSVAVAGTPVLVDLGDGHQPRLLTGKRQQHPDQHSPAAHVRKLVNGASRSKGRT